MQGFYCKKTTTLWTEAEIGEGVLIDPLEVEDVKCTWGWEFSRWFNSLNSPSLSPRTGCK